MSRDQNYYRKLITSQYQNSPNFMAWLTAHLNILSDISGCVDSLYAQFALDEVKVPITDNQGVWIKTSDGSPLMASLGKAIGVQLDILGQLIGASRIVSFQPTGGVSPILDDDTYRTLLKATIGLNNWDGRIDSLAPLWKQLFPTGTIQVIDNQNMSMDVYLSGDFTSIIVDLIENDMIVPRPEGVKINYHFGTQPYFGFDLENSYISGFDVGNWVS